MHYSLTIERLMELLHYDPETGLFTRLIDAGTSGKSRAGCIAGTRRHDGYVFIIIDRRSYSAHRLAWFYVHGRWPGHEIDHVDGNPSNNRLQNLREATHKENTRNRGAQRNNALKLKGVSYDARRERFRACIVVDGRCSQIGYFQTAEEASAAYAEAARKHFGEFARDF